ncbi:hypothetical protein SAMN04490203_2120 [Pseudomonas taetrolens]|uniref:Uncharacterized protein n=1 Tax=Pseudomonas taetrolens TaxID=47884 RepID=A0A1H4R7X5_PSETA|nr:hypothetical protein SAMN04490203_2120 [Pseudomonas taetrolens]SQF86273.1 Uncharacterised protein [Pseudomonas taetrolens]VEH49350.1 Uncharacterised protein [Pseudomonas taetrolens]
MGRTHRVSESPLLEILNYYPLRPYSSVMKENLFVVLYICLCITWIATVISVIYWYIPVIN